MSVPRRLMEVWRPGTQTLHLLGSAVLRREPEKSKQHHGSNGRSLG